MVLSQHLWAKALQVVIVVSEPVLSGPAFMLASDEVQQISSQRANSSVQPLHVPTVSGYSYKHAVMSAVDGGLPSTEVL